MSPGLQLLVLAKEPLPGMVKTRLCPPCTPRQAARLATAALADTLAACSALPKKVRRVLVLAGSRGPWLPLGWDIVPQRGGGLDERLAAAFGDAFAECDAPALLLGMDTPQVTTAMLATAGRALRSHDAVFGPAVDGGFWALGLRRPDPSLLLGAPMSTATTGAVVRGRLAAGGLRVAELPALVDVDTVAAARAVVAAAPLGAFARAFGELELVA